MAPRNIKSSPPDAFSFQALHLEGCLDKLPGEQRALVEGYYYRRTGIEALAGESNRTVEATYKLLQRVRHTLQRCVENAAQQEEATT